MGVISLLPAPASDDTDGSVAGVDGLNLAVEDPNKKIRKPYTITKSRQNWTEIEHDKFLEALHLFDRDWKKIEAFVGSKTAIQIRSHAQKYFLKVQKSGTNEHVPPPRPKRKAAHPYPHKAPKKAAPRIEGIFPSSGGLIGPGLYSWPTDATNTAVVPTWTYDQAAPVNEPTQDDMRSSGAAVSHNCCSSSSIGSGPGIWPTGDSNVQRKAEQGMTQRVLPDFAKVYRFIGSVFDPSESNHLQKLKTMDPVDVETVISLMKNLCANLKSPQFDHYRRLFSSYDAEKGKITSNSAAGNLRVTTGNAIMSW